MRFLVIFTFRFYSFIFSCNIFFLEANESKRHALLGFEGQTRVSKSAGCEAKPMRWVLIMIRFIEVL